LAARVDVLAGKCVEMPDLGFDPLKFLLRAIGGIVLRVRSVARN
jgi:hypothetical protein